MNILLVFAHPEPQSFNGAMLRTAVATLEAAGHQVRVSDLYAQPFEPVSDRRNFTTVQNAAYFKQQREEVYAAAHQGFALEVEAELQKLAWCDVMIWQFPLWWFSVPAVLKGWVDRVFAMGRVYGAGQIYENGVFRGKRALLSLTTGSGSPAEAYQPGGLQGDLLGILRPIHRGMLQFTGFTVLAPHVVYGPARLSMEERTAALAAWAARLPTLDKEAPLAVGTY
jgi:putative NADPH-quinone reductase